jgi:hypothetical protein
MQRSRDDTGRALPCTQRDSHRMFIISGVISTGSGARFRSSAEKVWVMNRGGGSLLDDAAKCDHPDKAWMSGHVGGGGEGSG